MFAYFRKQISRTIDGLLLLLRFSEQLALSIGFDNDNANASPSSMHDLHKRLPARANTQRTHNKPPQLPVRRGSLRSTTSQDHESNFANQVISANKKKAPCSQKDYQAQTVPLMATANGSAAIPVPPPPPPPPPLPKTGEPVPWKTRKNTNANVTFSPVIPTSSSQPMDDIGRQTALQRGRRFTEPAVLHNDSDSEPENYIGTSEKFKRLLESKLGGVKNPSNEAITPQQDEEDFYDVIDDVKRTTQVGFLEENSTNM